MSADTVILPSDDGPVLHAVRFEARGQGETECSLLFIGGTPRPPVADGCCEACAVAIETRGGFRL